METETLNSQSHAALEWARTHKKKRRIDVHALNKILAEHQMNQVLEGIDVHTLKKDVAQSPKLYFEIVKIILDTYGEMTKRHKVELESKIYKDEVAEQKRKVREALSSPDVAKGLSPETLREIEAAMAQL
jgi:hypothetical protein